jgi:hypothetical protein
MIRTGASAAGRVPTALDATGEVHGMVVATVVLAILFLGVGCMLGWHANRSYSAHGDIRVTKRRIGGYRRIRLRSGTVVLGLAALLLLAVVLLSHL